MIGGRCGRRPCFGRSGPALPLQSFDGPSAGPYRVYIRRVRCKYVWPGRLRYDGCSGAALSNILREFGRSADARKGPAAAANPFDRFERDLRSSLVLDHNPQHRRPAIVRHLPPDPARDRTRLGGFYSATNITRPSENPGEIPRTRRSCFRQTKQNPPIAAGRLCTVVDVRIPTFFTMRSSDVRRRNLPVTDSRCWSPCRASYLPCNHHHLAPLPGAARTSVDSTGDSAPALPRPVIRASLAAIASILKVYLCGSTALSATCPRDR